MRDEDRTHDDDSLQPGMAGSVVTATAMFAVSQGLTAQEIEAATGLSIDALIDRDARFPNDLVARIWARLLAHAPGRGLPLKMASAVPFDFFGPLAFGAQYAQNLRASLAGFIRYRKLLSTELEVELRDAGPEPALCFHHRSDTLDAGAGAEVGLALGARVTREVLGVPNAIARVTFGHRAHGPEDDYLAFFGVPVAFEAAENAIVFHAAKLEEPTPAGNPEAFAHIGHHLESVRARLLVADELAEVREAIAANAARSEYGAEALAKHMGMSLRALQRHVATHKGTVRALLDEAREAHARQLLGDRRLSVEEVAYLLGYSDERAFRRAFKRLTGATPAQFRRGAATATRSP